MLIRPNKVSEQEIIKESAKSKIYGNPFNVYTTFGQTNLSFVEIVSVQVSRSSKKGVAENILAVKIQPKPFSEDKELYGQPVTPQKEILDHLQTVFGEQTATALRVMDCESNGNRYAVSPTSDYGLFQINQIHFPEIPGDTYEEKIEWLFNPLNNISYAFTLYSRRGNFNDWVCFTKGLYK